MAPSWPLEALKAQAVISRSVARAKVAEAVRTPNQPYDLMDGLNDQDYRGAGRHGLLVARAVAETRGVVTVVKGGSLFQPLFCAASGGWTASSDAIQPGLKDISGTILLADTVMRPSRDPASEAGARALGDLSTHQRSEVQLKAETIRRGLARLLRPRGIEIGWIRDIRVVEREPMSKRALRVRINQLPGDPIELSANEFRLAITDERGRIPIRSTLWSEDSPKRIPDSQGRNDFAFTCYGLGHGVGLSQVSAWWLAREGKTAREILERFYGGDQLRTMPAW
jgi:peptidoglycan hydrolase-like amidase